MKNVTEALYYPYSHAMDHFEQVKQANWLGRTVHVIVGALECIPIFNYLVVLVELIVLRLFALMHNVVYPKPLAPLPIKLDGFSLWLDSQATLIDGVNPKFDEFTAWMNEHDDLLALKFEKDHLIWNNRAGPLRRLLGEFKEKIAAFKLDQNLVGYDFSAWDNGIAKVKNLQDGYELCVALRALVDELKPLDQARQHFLAGKAKFAALNPMLEGIRAAVNAMKQDLLLKSFDFSAWDRLVAKVTTQDGHQRALDLKTLVEALKVLDLDRQKFLERKLRQELSRVPALPEFKTDTDYFRFIGISNFGDQLGASKEKLPSFGLTNLADIQCLKLNRFQLRIHQLHRLSMALPLAPQARVLFEQAKAGLILDLKTLQESQPLIDLLNKPELDFALIEAADKQLQIARLKAYILQQDNTRAWAALKGMDITTLAQYCVTNEVTELTSLYEIGLNYGQQ